MFNKKNESTSISPPQENITLNSIHNAPLKRKKGWTLYRIIKYSVLLVVIIASALLFTFARQKRGPHLKNYMQYNYVLEIKEPLDNSILPMQTYATDIKNKDLPFNTQVITPLIENFKTFKYITADNLVLSNFSISSFNDAVNTYNSWPVDTQKKYVEIIEQFSRDLPGKKDSFPTHYDDLTNLATMLMKIDMSIVASATEYNEGGTLSLVGTIIIVTTLLGLFIIGIYRMGAGSKEPKLPSVQN